MEVRSFWGPSFGPDSWRLQHRIGGMAPTIPRGASGVSAEEGVGRGSVYSWRRFPA